MDSRDIIEEPIKVVGGKYLECMYSLQKELLEQYIKVEGLPQYPIDVNTKKSQIILKDFVGRVIEELAEGYEALILVSKLTEKNKLWKSDYEEEEYIQCLNHLQNAGEEMADAMHFMLELLIYSNIQAKDIELDKFRSISLLNVRVTHKQYGTGIVIAQKENTIKVRFPEGLEKSFIIHTKFPARPTFEDDEQVVEAFTEYDRLTREIQGLKKLLEIEKAKVQTTIL